MLARGGAGLLVPERVLPTPYAVLVAELATVTTNIDTPGAFLCPSVMSLRRARQTATSSVAAIFCGQDGSHRRRAGRRAVALDRMLESVGNRQQQQRHDTESSNQHDENPSTRHTHRLGDRRRVHEHQRQLRPSRGPETRASTSFARPRRASRSSILPSYGPYTSEELVGEALAPFRDNVAHRDQVRLRHRGGRAQQPTGAHQEGGRGLAQAPQDRPHRSSTTSIASIRTSPIEDVAGARSRT